MSDTNKKAGAPPIGRGPGGRHAMMMQHRKPKHTRKTLFRLFRYLGRYWHILLLALFCTAFTTVGTVFATRWIGVAIDEHIAVFDFAGLWKTCVMLFAFYACSSVVTASSAASSCSNTNESTSSQISSLPCFVSAENGIMMVPGSTFNPTRIAFTCF